MVRGPGNCHTYYPLTPALAFIYRKAVVVAQVDHGVFIAGEGGEGERRGQRKKKVENPWPRALDGRLKGCSQI